MAAAGLIQNLKAQISSPVGFAVSKPKPTVGWGLPGLDQLTGGIPRGAMMEIHSGTSSGRSSLAARLLAVLTREGEICAYLDAANGFDPPSAAAAGCVLSRVLWIKCGGRLDQALQAGDQLLNAGGFGLIVMDLLGLTPRMLNKIPASYWFRFRRVLEGSNTTLVLLSSRSLMQSCSALTLELQRNEAQWVGRSKFAVLGGYGVRTGMTRPGPGGWASLPIQHGGRSGRGLGVGGWGPGEERLKSVPPAIEVGQDALDVRVNEGRPSNGKNLLSTNWPLPNDAHPLSQVVLTSSPSALSPTPGP